MAKVVLIEDNPANRKLAMLLLENAGHTVLALSCGEEGLRLVRETQPDLVLVDIQMPGIDGLEVTRRLRDDPATAELKIVALTALAMKGDADRILDAGCDGYIAKPYRYQEFLDQIAAALER